MATKPSSLPQWADDVGAAITEPTTPEKATGWLPAQKPPAQWFNWWMNLVYLWAVWLDAFEDEAHTWTAVQTYEQGVIFENGATIDGAVVFSPSLGTVQFNAGATFNDRLLFSDFGGVDGYAIEAAGLLRIGSSGGTGGYGGAAGEIRLTSGPLGGGHLILEAKEIHFAGVGEEDDAIRIEFGNSVGPDRVRAYVINGTLWILYNATYNSGTQEFARVDNAKNSTAICIGQDNDFGLHYPVKVLIRNLESTTPWAPSLWKTTGEGVGSAVGLGALAREAPQIPTLLNNFVDDVITPSVGPVRYWKDPIGNVHFQGGLQWGAGSANNTAFVLPVGYRPAYRRWIFGGPGTADALALYVDTNGNVVGVGGSAGERLQLDGAMLTG